MKNVKIALCVLMLTVPFAGAVAQSLAGKKIYINPGHGGYEAVATTPVPGQFANGYRSDGSSATDRWVATIPFPSVCEEGVWESKHNLWRGLELRRLLEAAGATVMMSRTENRPQDDRILLEIGEEATTWGADMFVSIHTNASDKNYVLTLFRGADPRPGQPFNIADPDLPASKEMAVTAWRHLHDNNLTCWQARKGENDVYAVSDSAFYSSWTDGYHLGVLRKLWVPGFLAECSFHDYKPEAHRLLNPDYSNLIAYQLYTAICDYFKAPLPATGIIAGAVKDSQRVLRDPLFLGATYGDHDMYLPLNGAKVTLTGNGVNKEYTTDNYYNGMFYFPDLAPGTYKLHVEAAGYISQDVDVVCEAAKSRGPIVMLDDPEYDPNTTATPNVYASALKAIAPNTVSFTLNGDATEVTVNLLKDGRTVREISLGARPKGVNTVEMAGLADLTDEDFIGGNYAWSITASGVQIENPDNAEVGQVSTNGDPLLDIANARGIAIDNNTDSPYFGRMYVTSIEANGKKGARMGTGLYILGADGSDVTGQGGVPYNGGENWSGNSGPYRSAVAPNGDVYVCDWTDAHSGIWVMNPAEPKANWRAVFGGTRNGDGLASEGGVKIHGSVPGLFITGKGADTKLYALDEDYDADGKTHLLRFDIGTQTTPWVTAPSKEYGLHATLVNANQDVAYDAHGGAWVSQYRYQPDAYPCVSHINLTSGEYDYTSVIDGKESIFTGTAPVGCMGVSPDGKYVAVANAATVEVAEATYDANGVPSLKLKWSFGSTYGSRPFDIDFDVAGNIYVAYNDNGGGIGIWALPKADNSYTTTANDLLMVATAGVANVSVSADVEPVYFDTMGRVVANPEAGKLYIERRGEKVNKIIR